MLTNKQFQEKLKQVNKGIKTDTIYNGNNTIMDCTCKYGHSFNTKAYNLIYNKTGCPICSGIKINIGFNDMWTTNPKLAELLLYKEDGYKYTQCSEKKVWWKCPCCSEHIYKKISYVNKRGIVCNKCSDNISFPNRFMYNVLFQLNVDFETEYMLNGANYRYDFYIERYNLIIEMQGRQHYDGWNSKRITKEEIQENDKNKKDFALDNGISIYIEIDARESNKNYISNSILSSELVNYFNFDVLDWNRCLIDSIKSFVGITAQYYNNGFSVDEISKTMKMSKTSIYRWLKIGTDLKMCNWIPSNGFLYDEKPVILINTLQTYPSISKASSSTNQNLQNISDVCNHKRKYCGILDNHPMIWMFLDEYNGETIDSFDIYLSHKSGIKINKYTLDGKYVETYNTLKEAKNISGVPTIINVCSKKKFQAGTIRWYYADDMMQPDKTKIIGEPSYYGEDKKYIGKAQKYNELINNKYSSVMIDVYDRYGIFLGTYIGYNEVSKNTNCSKESIYACCSGNSAYSDKYVFRYHNDTFNKYFYPDLFSKYINVYEKESMNYVNTYYSIQEAAKQLNLSGTNSAYKALRKERKYAYGYMFYYANDPDQPDKSKVIS